VNPKISGLRKLLQDLEQPRPQREARISSGCKPLDRLLPGGGFARGSLVEWLAAGPGSGAAVLALTAAREACCDGGVLVVVDRDGTFYPPAAAAWGVDLQSAIVVRPTNEKDEHWALDQALRCPDVAAVFAWPKSLDGLTFRRLQLATETSGGLGMFVRPATTRAKPSWANVRLLVEPRVESRELREQGKRVQHSLSTLNSRLSTHWRLRVEILRCRGLLKKSEIELEIDDRTGEIHETHSRRLATKLAGTTARARQARA
jgi:hypothetical protein